MSRAHDLFSRIRNGGSAALEELILEREPESLFLDFKRSPNDGASKTLSTEDNRNLSRAISGFANSSGGVVIWGVDCRRDNLSGNEVAEKHPIYDASGFNTKLQSAISRTTIPPHTGVQVYSFEESDSSPAGYVAVLIPQSTFGPVRSVATNHYHLRSGSDFGIVPHDVLAGMFGKTPQPKVNLNIISYPARTYSRQGHLTVAFGLVAVNFGAVMAERPYLSVFFGSLPPLLLNVRTPDNAAFSVRRSPLPTLSVLASRDFSLPPGASEHLCDVVIDIPIDKPRDVVLECTLGVRDTPPKRFTLSASRETVAAAIQEAASEAIQSTDIIRLEAESQRE